MKKDEILKMFNDAKSVSIFCDTFGIETHQTVLYLHGEKVGDVKVRVLDLFHALGKSTDDFERVFSGVLYTRYPTQGYLNTNPTFYLDLSRELNRIIIAKTNTYGLPAILVAHGINEDSTKAPFIEYLHPHPK
jgi:hypothetical protein